MMMITMLCPQQHIVFFSHLVYYIVITFLSNKNDSVLSILALTILSIKQQVDILQRALLASD